MNMECKELIHDVVLCAGSNIEPRGDNVSRSISWLLTILSDSEYSEIYETPEIHGIGAPYANAVIMGRTSMEMKNLDILLKRYETLSGRDEEARRKMEVPIDIDIVIWDGRIVRDKDFRQSFFQIGYRLLNGEMKVDDVEIFSSNYQI